MDAGERYAAVSPPRLLPTGVPQLLIHGTRDDVVPLMLSETYAGQARAAGDSAELCVVEGADHFQIRDPATVFWPTVRGAICSFVGLEA